MTDGYVQVPPDSSGARIDTTERINADQIAVDRQRVEIPDVVQVSGDQLAGMLIEQRVQNLLLAAGFNVKDDVDDLRDSVSGEALNVQFIDLIDGPTSYSGFAGYHLAVNADEDGLEFVAAREILTANRDYYVLTSGSDSNDGLTNTTGGAFLTVQHAVDVVFGDLDIGPYIVTINIGAGTFAEAVNIGAPATGITGSGYIAIAGAGSTTIVTSFGFSGGVVIGDMRNMATTFLVGAGSTVFFAGITFSTSSVWQITAQYSGLAYCYGSCTVTNAASVDILIHVRDGGVFFSDAATWTFTGTPVFNAETVLVSGTGDADISQITFSGAATGIRYLAKTNGVINTNGGGANFIPGSIAGSTATGGQYV